ncbi:MAG: hypothetical protein KDB24_16460 [Microthrixaceae bacterium]|nr:hypothetical protein [Microthrixaceae bacterium]
MTSASLDRWRQDRAHQLDELISAHQLVGGATAGRRWATGELNRALVLRLAAQFQGFARDLHQEAAFAFGTYAQPNSPAVAQVVATGMQASRDLDRRNASADALAKDFARLGLKLWEAMQERDRRTSVRRSNLHWINMARNGLAHNDQSKLDLVVESGYQLDLSTIRRWRRALDGLAGTMDVVVADHLASLFERPMPW